MSDVPGFPFDPDDLPEELRELLDQVGPAMEQLAQQGGLQALFGGAGGGLPGMGGGDGGPVQWDVARRFALEIVQGRSGPGQLGPGSTSVVGDDPDAIGFARALGAAIKGSDDPDADAELGEGDTAELDAGGAAADEPPAPDREPTDAERTAATRAWQASEHWLDEGPLPTPSTGGRLVVASREQWVEAALDSMRPWVEPVAGANTRAMADLAAEQIRETDLDELGIPGLSSMLGQMGGIDPSGFADMLRPMGAWLTGVQAGQVLGTLAGQLLGQYDLGIPLAPRDEVWVLAVNVARTFDGYDLDRDEVLLALLLQEGAHRRLYAAVPWLEAHLHGLVAQFANGVVLDAEALSRMAMELMQDVDMDDPASVQRAQDKAASLRLTPTEAQERVLARLQTVVALVGAWARAEARRVASSRLPNLASIEEVLRRRRATAGDGETMLSNLLGLDLRPADPAIGDLFVAHVESEAGPDRLRMALEHPEMLPSADELADPAAWLARASDDTGDDGVPDDLSALLDGTLGDAPVERSADERLTGPHETDDGDA